MAGVTVSVPASVPEAGETASQAASSEAVQLIVWPPVLATASVLAAGSAPPWVALKARLVGVTDSAGGTTGLTVSDTGTVTGDPAAPGAVTVIDVVYVPAARLVLLGVTVIVPVPVPDVGEMLSQVALWDALQLSVPPPALLTLSVLAAGLAPPSLAVNERLAGETDSAGVGGPPFLNTTAAMLHGVLAPVDTRGAGVSPRPAVASSTSNSMSLAGETFTRSV